MMQSTNNLLFTFEKYGPSILNKYCSIENYSLKYECMEIFFRWNKYFHTILIAKSGKTSMKINQLYFEICVFFYFEIY